MRVLLGMNIVLVIAGVAGADVVLFNNWDGAYVWPLGSFELPETVPEHSLDITQGSGQTGTAALHGLMNTYHDAVTSSDFDERYLSPYWTSAHAVRVARDPVPVTVENQISSDEFYFHQLFHVGETVGPDAEWDESVNYWVGSAIDDHGHAGRQYLGVELQLSGQAHYGWVLVDFVDDSGPSSPERVIAVPLQWAYETEPNTPITIVPAPGAAVLLGGGLIVAGVRRRRV